MRDMTEQHNQLVKDDLDVEMKYKEPIGFSINILDAIALVKRIFNRDKTKIVKTRDIIDKV